MKLRMHQIAVEVNDKEEIIISQERRDAGQEAAVTISMEQVDYLYDLLQRARKEIEARREKQEEEGEEKVEERSFSGRRR
jgi:hypothetical protein